MLEYMLDTSICIYVLRDRPPALRQRFDREADRVCISTVCLTELYYGVEKSARRPANLQAVEGFIARLEVLDFSAAAAAHHGQLRTELKRLGRLAGPYDMLIGAHARSQGLIVVTNNVREFTRMPGLRAENWL